MVSNAKKNALSYYLNTAVTAVVGLVVNPLLLNTLSATNFGAWKTIQRLLDVGSAANGGAMQSLKWVIAHRSRSVNDQAKRRDVGAALVVLLYWSPVLIAVTAVIVVALPVLMRDMPEADTGMIYVTGSILGANVILMALAAVPGSVLIGTNQGFLSVNITTAVLIVTNISMVGAAVIGLGTEGMALAVAVGTCINGALTFRVLRKRVSWWGVAKPSRDDIRRLSRFSGLILVWTFVYRLSLATEVIVLSAVAGASSVSSYIFTSYVAVFGLSLCQLTTSALMPRLGSAIGNGQWQDAQSIAREVRELTLALVAGIGSLLILLNGPFVEIWAGREQFMGYGANILMVIAFMQFAIIVTDAQIQDTGLAIGVKVILGAIMTIATIAAAGVALALSGSVAVMYLAICATRLIGTVGFPILANRAVKSSSWPIGRGVMALAVLSAAILMAKFLHVTNVLELIVVGIIAAAFLGPLVFFTVLSPSTRRKLLRH